MSAYFEDDSVTIHHGDCLDVMRGMEPCSIDSIVTDPPYGSGTTCKAARAEGFRSIMCDLDEEHCAIAKGRLSQGMLL